MILDRTKFPELARTILSVPEEILARADKRAVIDLAVACKRANYVYGDLFLQLLALRAQHLDDCQVQRRTKELVGTLRAQIFSDAGRPVAELNFAAVHEARLTLARAT